MFLLSVRYNSPDFIWDCSMESSQWNEHHPSRKSESIVSELSVAFINNPTSALSLRNDASVNAVATLAIHTCNVFTIGSSLGMLSTSFSFLYHGPGGGGATNVGGTVGATRSVGDDASGGRRAPASYRAAQTKPRKVPPPIRVGMALPYVGRPWTRRGKSSRVDGRTRNAVGPMCWSEFSDLTAP